MASFSNQPYYLINRTEVRIPGNFNDITNGDMLVAVDFAVQGPSLTPLTYTFAPDHTNYNTWTTKQDKKEVKPKPDVSTFRKFLQTKGIICTP